jgi:hypothetical protein
MRHILLSILLCCLFYRFSELNVGDVLRLYLFYYDANSDFPATPPPRPGGGGGGGMLLSYSWKEGTLVYRQNGGAVLLVNVFVKLSSPAPTRDRALIVYRLLVWLSL